MINLVDTPISTKDYDIYSIGQLPRVVLGYKVKNKFDEARLKIKKKYKPKHISHFIWTHQLEPVFFYGIELNITDTYSPLLKDINYNMSPLRQDIHIKYKNILSRYDLSCDTCYRYISDGVYPVDIKYLANISRKSFDTEIKSGFAPLLQKTKNPWYFCLPNFNIFILTRSVGYEMDYNLQ